MPCTIYLNSNEEGIALPVPEVQQWLDLVRRKTNKRWIVMEREIRTGWIFTKKTTLYSLAVDIGHGEFQMINFFRGDSDTSINQEVPLDVLAALLMGKA